MIRVEKVTTREGFEQLADEWNRLLERSASNTITLTFEWLTTWWDVFGTDRELYILLAREGDELIGIAPLLKRTIHRYGVLSYHRLEFLASGEDEADEICSEYLDFILLRGREADALQAFIGYLRDGEPEWDETLLTDMAEQSPNLPLLAGACQAAGMKWKVVRTQDSIYLPLPGRWADLMASLSHSFRKKIERDRRVFNACGGEVRLIEGRDGFEENFDILVRLHQSRWTGRGEPGVFSSERFTRFHRMLAPRLLDRGWLKLFVLVVAGEPVSALYSFTHNRKMHYYQGGFIPGRARLSSPGTLLQCFAMEKAIEMGLTEYDFLKGEIGGYKSRWGGRARSVLQLRVAQAHSKEALYTTTSKFIDGLRYIKRSLPLWVAFWLPWHNTDLAVVESLAASLFLLYR